MISIYDVLKASKGIHVDDTFAYLWGKKLSTVYTVATYTGTLPATLKTVEGYLESYKIYGNTVQNGTPTPENPIIPSGCGERTGNLFSSMWEQGFIDAETGQNMFSPRAVRTKDYILIKPNVVYSFRRDIVNGYINIRLYGADKTYIGLGSKSNVRLVSGISAGNPMIDNVPFCCFEIIDSEVSYIRFNDLSNNTATKWLMVEGEYTQETMPEYEPYGYKLPLAVNGVEYPIYLGDAQLAKDEYVDSETGKIYHNVGGELTPIDPPAPFPRIPTVAGTTIIDYDGTPKPEKVELTYRKWKGQ